MQSMSFALIVADGDVCAADVDCMSGSSDVGVTDTYVTAVLAANGDACALKPVSKSDLGGPVSRSLNCGGYI